MDHLPPTPNALGYVAKWIVGSVVAYVVLMWLGSNGLIWVLTHIHP